MEPQVKEEKEARMRRRSKGMPRRSGEDVERVGVVSVVVGGAESGGGEAGSSCDVAIVCIVVWWKFWWFNCRWALERFPCHEEVAIAKTGATGIRDRVARPSPGTHLPLNSYLIARLSIHHR